MTSWSCPACGGDNPEGMRFCGHCGTPRAATADVPAAAEAPPPSAADTLRSFVATPVADRLVESGGHIAEERRLITAVFADISGFTALAERVDTEELLEIIDPIVARLSAIVGRYGGYVEKFAGDALLALFGAPVAHEDDAARALHVALEMQREIARIRDELPGSAGGLTLHVGVNSGHGIARIIGSAERLDYGVLGDSVILAQRLESAAPSGEIYVGEITHALTRRLFELEPLGELTVKGKSEPVRAWRLVGVRTAGSSTRALGLVGRSRELEVATSAVARLRDGTGGLLTIAGEPGAGKSSLLAAVRDAAGADVTWLDTRCLAYGAALPYRPVAELIRAFAQLSLEAGPEVVRPALGAALDAFGAADRLPMLARVAGLPPTAEEDAAAAALEPEALQRAAQDAVAGWLAAVAARAPLAVAIEDVHWMDASSLAAFTDVAAEAARSPILLVTTARSDSDPSAGALAEPLGDAAVAVSLGPLGEAAVAELAADRLGGAVDASFASALSERTGGNPLFVDELVRSLAESGALVDGPTGWSTAARWDEADVPPTIEGVLAARLDRLPARARQALQAGAVIGRRLRSALLRAVLADEPGLDDTLDQLVGGGFLDHVAGPAGDELWFHHALVQDVAYARLLRRQRRELHRQVADIAERLYGSGDDVIDLLARHLYLGDGGAKAVEYLERAGRHARSLFANDEAIVDFERAVEVAGKLAATDPDVAARVPALRLEIGDLLELAGRYDQAQAVFREVATATDDVRAWRGVAAIHRLRGEYGPALEAVDEALAATDAAGERGVDRRPLWLERAWTLSLEGRISEARAAAAAGLDGSPAGDATHGRLLLQLARIENVAGAPADGLARADEAAATFAAIGDQPGLAIADRVAGDALRRLHRMDEAAARLVRGLATAERVGSSEELGANLVNLGMVESDRERFTEAAAAFARATAEFERAGNRNGAVLAESNLADLLVRSGDVAAGRAAAQRALARAREIGNEPIAADLLDTLAQAARADGDARAEAARWDEASAAYEAIEEWDRAAETATEAAGAWTRAGDMERARDRESRARGISERALAVH